MNWRHNTTEIAQCQIATPVDISTCYCRHHSCHLYGRSGHQAQLHPRGTHNQAPRFECGACGHLVFARTGTAYAGIRVPELTFRDGIRQLAEGASIRAVARNIECDKDTVCHWLPRVGQNYRDLVEYFCGSFEPRPLASHGMPTG